MPDRASSRIPTRAKQSTEEQVKSVPFAHLPACPRTRDSRRTLSVVQRWCCCFLSISAISGCLFVCRDWLNQTRVGPGFFLFGYLGRRSVVEWTSASSRGVATFSAKLICQGAYCESPDRKARQIKNLLVARLIVRVLFSTSSRRAFARVRQDRHPHARPTRVSMCVYAK